MTTCSPGWHCRPSSEGCGGDENEWPPPSPPASSSRTRARQPGALVLRLPLTVTSAIPNRACRATTPGKCAGWRLAERTQAVSRRNGRHPGTPDSRKRRRERRMHLQRQLPRDAPLATVLGRELRMTAEDERLLHLRRREPHYFEVVGWNDDEPQVRQLEEPLEHGVSHCVFLHKPSCPVLRRCRARRARSPHGLRGGRDAEERRTTAADLRREACEAAGAQDRRGA